MTLLETMNPIHRLASFLLCIGIVGVAGSAVAQDDAFIRMHPAERLAKKEPETLLQLGELDTPIVLNLDAAAHFANRFIQPKLRSGEEIKTLGKQTLIAFARREQHAWLRTFIATNSELGAHTLFTQCVFLRMGAKAYKKHFAPLLEKRGVKRQHAVLAKSEKTKKYLADVQKLRGVVSLLSPSLLTIPAQRATLSVLSETTYVKDFETEFDAKGKLRTVNPVIGILRSGTLLDTICGMVRPNVVGLSLLTRWCDVEKPMRSYEVRFKGCDTKIKIQTPKVRMAEIKVDVEMPLGATVMFELPSTKWPHLIVFATVTLKKS